MTRPPMFDTRSDDERAAFAHRHRFGIWRRDLARIGDDTAYRRDCKDCKAWQEGRGTPYGFNIVVTALRGV